MPNLISSLMVFVGRGGRSPVAPFSQSSQACAAPVARSSTAILVRSSLFIISPFFSHRGEHYREASIITLRVQIAPGAAPLRLWVVIAVHAAPDRARCSRLHFPLLRSDPTMSMEDFIREFEPNWRKQGDEWIPAEQLGCKAGHKYTEVPSFIDKSPPSRLALRLAKRVTPASVAVDLRDHLRRVYGWMKPCGCIGMIGICPAITQSGTIARARKITVEAPNIVHYVTALCACRSRSHESPGRDGQGKHHVTHSQSPLFNYLGCCLGLSKPSLICL